MKKKYLLLLLIIAFIPFLDLNAQVFTTRSWQRFFNGSAETEALAVAVDASGNSYTTGYCRGTDFTSLFGPQDKNIFIMKASPAGVVLGWMLIGSSPGADETGLAISIGSSGTKVCITGSCVGSLVKLNESPAHAPLPGTPATGGNTAMFVCVFDLNLNPLAADVFPQKSGGGFTVGQLSTGNGVYMGNMNHMQNPEDIYITGAIKAPISNLGAEFDNKTVNLYGLVANTDAYVGRFRTNNVGGLDCVWMRTMGSTSGNDAGTGIAIGSGILNIPTVTLNISGYFNGTFKTDIYNTSTMLLTPASHAGYGADDAFMASIYDYGTAGYPLYYALAGSSGDDRANAITAHAGGELFTVGYYSGLMGTYSSSPYGGLYGFVGLPATFANSKDVFILSIDHTCGFIWGKQDGGTKDDIANGACVVKLGEACSNFLAVTGSFKSISAFNYGAPCNDVAFNSDASGSTTDGFVAVYDVLVPNQIKLQFYSTTAFGFNDGNDAGYGIAWNAGYSSEKLVHCGAMKSTLLNNGQPNHLVDYGICGASTSMPLAFLPTPTSRIHGIHSMAKYWDCGGFSKRATGVNNLNGVDFKLSVFPNPSSSDGIVSVESNIGGTSKLDVVNVIGTVVYSSSPTLLSGKNEISLPLSALAKGTYVLRLTSNGGTKAIKFIKQ